MGAHRKDYGPAVDLYRSGQSIEAVASAYGITRQAMHTILKRRGVEFRANLRFGKENHFDRGGAVRGAVHFVVAKALRRGLLVVQPCETCALPPAIENGRQRIHAHHDDYNHLLRVRWLCKRCHHEWHKTNTPVARSLSWSPTPHSVIASMGGKASRQR